MTMATVRSAIKLRGQSILVDIAYDEFCRREAGGERVDAEAFLAEHPDIPGLAHLLTLHRFLEEDPKLTEPHPAEYWPVPGEHFAGFHLLRELGRGSFARVYLAEESALGRRKVAVKISVRASVEAATLGRLDHPNIVPIFSVQEHEAANVGVVCMPYLGHATLEDAIEAASLEERMPSRAAFLLDLAADADAPDQGLAQFSPPTPYVEAVRTLALQLAQALVFIHSRGIIHRDLKPSNVLLKPCGTPMLLDFNLAADALLPELVRGGTPDYMAPEQLQGHAELVQPAPAVTAAADVFSWGVILYQMLTGQHPFGPIPSPVVAGDLLRLLTSAQQQGPRPLRQFNPSVDRPLADLIESCLALDPDRRPTAENLVEQLQRQQRWLPVMQRRLVRHPVRAALAALILVGALAAGGLAFAALRAQDPGSVQSIATALKDGDLKQAVRLANQALEADPKNLEALYLRGRAHQRLAEKEQHNWTLAFNDFHACSKQEAEGRFQACMGFCLHRQGQRDYAQGHYERAVDLAYASAELHNNLGLLYLANSYLDKAKVQFTRALQLKEGFGPAHHQLARVYLQRAYGSKDLIEKRGLLNQARSHCQQALQAAHTTDLLFDAGQVFAQAAQFDRSHLDAALDFFAQALEQGFDPETLKALKNFPALEGNQRFQELCQRQRVDSTPSRATLVFDPVVD